MRSTFALSKLFVSLILAFSANSAGAAMLCHRTHATGLSGEQIASRIDALIAQQIRMQQNGFSEPALFAQSRAYIENEKQLLDQAIPDFERTYRDRYLLLRGQLKQKHQAQTQRAKVEEQKRQETIQTVRAVNPKESFRIPHDNEPTNPHFTPDGLHILTAYWDPNSNKFFIQVTDAVSGRFLNKIEYSIPLRTAKFSADGKFFVVLHPSSKIIIGETFLGRIQQIPLPLLVEFLAVEISPDGKFVITSNALKQVLVYDVSSGGIVHQLENMEWFPEAGFDANGNFLASKNGVIEWYSPVSGMAQHSASLTLSDAKSKLMSPDRKLRAKVTEDGTVKIVDADSGAVLHETEHQSETRDPVFSPDGKFLATITGNERVVSVFEISSGQVIHQIKHKGQVSRIKFSADSTRLVTTAEVLDQDAIVTSLYQDLGD